MGLRGRRTAADVSGNMHAKIRPATKGRGGYVFSANTHNGGCVSGTWSVERGGGIRHVPRKPALLRPRALSPANSTNQGKRSATPLMPSERTSILERGIFREGGDRERPKLKSRKMDKGANGNIAQVFLASWNPTLRSRLIS